MSLIKWSPFFDQFEDMEKMFSDFAPVARGARNSFVPAVDMYEDNDNVVVETQLAGINPEDINISIENDVLCLKGEAEKRSEVDDKNYYRREIRRGSFFRSVQLPTHVESDKASAVAEDGVLRITIPKSPEVKPRKIQIETKKK